MEQRIHILGASGAGTSTLARNLANALGIQSFDTDDFYWLPTDPPFQKKRPAADRLALMETVFLPRPDWILAGPFHSWGAPISERLTHVFLVTLPKEDRLARLTQREAQRWGDRIEPGGAFEAHFHGFMDWARQYDDPAFSGRSLRQQEQWLATLNVPVHRLDSTAPPTTLTQQALALLSA